MKNILNEKNNLINNYIKTIDNLKSEDNENKKYYDELKNEVQK